MRLLQIIVKPEAVEELREFYDDRVIPALQRVNGCLSAKLVRSNIQPETFVSMTLWQNRQDADTYEKGEVFQGLLEEADPLFSESSEWKIQLSDSQELTYGPVKEEPVITSYPVKVQEDLKLPKPPDQPETSRMCMRIVSTKVKKAKLEEFYSIYEQEIIPALRTADGCLYAYLAENIGGNGGESGGENEEVFSITIWESQEKAEQYAAGGLFSQVVRRARHTFSQLSQWNLSLEKGESKKVKTSDDLTINRYSIITGKQFD